MLKLAKVVRKRQEIKAFATSRLSVASRRERFERKQRPHAGSQCERRRNRLAARLADPVWGMTGRVGGCTGECCREFPLNMSMLEVERRGLEGQEEYAKVSSMLILLTDSHEPYRPYKWAPDGTMLERGSPRYTCKHWDRQTKRCMDHANRPDLCSRYPYGGKCQHCGDGLSAPLASNSSAGVI